MMVEEYAAKRLLAERGIAVPPGRVVASPRAAADAARELGSEVALKAQVPTGGRGKAGLIRFAESASDAHAAASELLGARVEGVAVEQVLVEARLSIERELYAAVIIDPTRRSPVLLFSTEGGVDIETSHATIPDRTLVHPLDVRRPLELGAASRLLHAAALDRAVLQPLARTLVTLASASRALDAELLEINPLALTTSGELVAVDCKLVVDDSALGRQPQLPAARARGTELEQRARAAGLLYIELDGDVGLLANGAGLTMATMDAIAHHGGRPANFMEIGGDAYRKASAALEIVLRNPRVKSLLVNLCGAFARTDVIAGGLVAAWAELQPSVRVAASIHGTGKAAAVRLVRDQLGIEPYDDMDAAVRAAIGLAQETR